MIGLVMHVIYIYVPTHVCMYVYATYIQTCMHVHMGWQSSLGSSLILHLSSQLGVGLALLPKLTPTDV
jgi:hypothetical protein